MNIKINIKDCDCSPTVITRKQMSQVQFKKKNMLYAPPTKDKKTLQQNTSKKINANQKNNSIYQSQNNVTQYTQNQQFLEAQKKLVQDLSEISKNQATSDMIHNSNTILQRQNQIIESNQKAIHALVSNNKKSNNQMQNQSKNKQFKKMFQESADKIAKQVKQIKKMRDQILEAGQQFKKLLTDGKNSNINKGSQQIGNMNNNLRNMVEISKHHMDGLQNLQGIKNLQNFNIQAYTQSINTLKKQIVQYQKQSQTIQRQLKIRAAKLQKLDISPNFDQQLLQPYQDYLKKKADSIDLHSLKQKVYQKLGVFDYGKFQYDISLIMNQVKSDISQFDMICKKYRIQAPDIKIDNKELRQLDLKLPSVLDQFKVSRGIIFNEQVNKGNQEKGKKNLNTRKNESLQNTSQQPIKRQQIKKPNLKKTQQQNKQLQSKPIDYSNEVKFTRLDKQKYTSVLQTNQQKQRKQVQKNMKSKNIEKNKDQQFQKYLQNRARQQLALIYQQKKKKLKQMQKQLYETCKEQTKPQYELRLNLKNKIQIQDKNKIKKIKEQKYQNQDQYQNQYGDDFENVQQQRKHKKSASKQEKELKNIGTQVLRQKLKNLFTKNKINIHQNENIPLHNRHIIQSQSKQAPSQAGIQMQSIAQGFINMINNTLTQVNSSLSQSIQKKMQNNRSLSKEGNNFQRKVPNKIIIPKLEQIRAPPIYNMQLVQQPIYRPQARRSQKKITAKNFDHLKINDQQSDLEVNLNDI